MVKDEGTWRDTWFWKTITFAKFISFIKGLIDKKDPHSSHEAVNLTWGLGSFVFYWMDHFLAHRVFTNQDYVFIASMAGITALSSLSSKKTDASGNKEDSDGLGVDQSKSK
jgi:hypothetical protein